MLKRIICVLFALATTAMSVEARAASCPAYPYTLTNGTTADANQVMSNFDNIMNCLSLFVGGSTAGSATVQTLATVAPSTFALTAGNRVTFIAGYSSTGATTLNVATTGAKSILKKMISGLVALEAKDMVVNQVYTVQYDGTQFQLLDPALAPFPTLGSAAYADASAFQPSGQYVVATNGQTITVSPVGPIHTIKLKPAGTIAGVTLSFPISTLDNEMIWVVSTQTITTVTMSGATFDGTALTTLAAGGSAAFIYSANDGKYTRIQ